MGKKNKNKLTKKQEKLPGEGLITAKPRRNYKN